MTSDANARPDPFGRDFDVPPEVLDEYVTRGDTTVPAESAAPATATATAEAANPFILTSGDGRALPGYTALRSDDTPHGPPPAPEDTPPPPEDDPEGYTGQWDSWVDDDTTTASTTAATGAEPGPEPVTRDPGKPAAAVAYDADIPDYDDPDSVAAFVDRTGGTRMASGYQRPAPQRIGGPSRTGRVTAIAVAAVAAVTVGAVVAINLNSGTPAPATPAAGPTVSTVVDTAAATEDLPPTWDHALANCVRTRTPSAVVGADPGDTSNGPSAILAFEWAYYVQRDAAAARALTTPDARVAPADYMQREGIDQVPLGTKYCVYISPGDTSGRVWDVELHEKWPNEATPGQWRQTITTTVVDGRTLITSVATK